MVASSLSSQVAVQQSGPQRWQRFQSTHTMDSTLISRRMVQHENDVENNRRKQRKKKKYRRTLLEWEREGHFSSRRRLLSSRPLLIHFSFHRNVCNEAESKLRESVRCEPQGIRAMRKVLTQRYNDVILTHDDDVI